MKGLTLKKGLIGLCGGREWHNCVFLDYVNELKYQKKNKNVCINTNMSTRVVSDLPHDKAVIQNNSLIMKNIFFSALGLLIHSCVCVLNYNKWLNLGGVRLERGVV